MTANGIPLLPMAMAFTVLLAITGFYCLVVTRNIIRALIGIELLMKAVTLLLIAIAYATGRTGLGQSLVITIIVIEVVIAAIAGGIAIRVYSHNESIDATRLRRMKG